MTAIVHYVYCIVHMYHWISFQYNPIIMKSTGLLQNNTSKMHLTAWINQNLMYKDCSHYFNRLYCCNFLPQTLNVCRGHVDF